ncbi:50S ribosomal protein L19e [Candidatus Woesearchaeota archaeon]|nr:50S ribosomal protein L19e [Candidatus Woesearchaeota archaeon]
MKFTVQRRLAADVMGCSPSKVWFDASKLDQIKEAITKADLRSLVNSGIVREKPTVGSSRGRIRKATAQRTKGRRSGHGSRKGVKTARESRKQTWIYRIRLQRSYLQELKEAGLLAPKSFRELYLKCKGGFFRSKRHVTLYLEENSLLQKKSEAASPAPIKK